jgi:hypothetical protein
MTAKQTFLNWLAQNDLKKVLKGLLLLANRYKYEQLRNDATFQSGRLKALEAQRLKNTISSDEDKLETAKIRQALLHIINDMPNNWTLEEIEINTDSYEADPKSNWKKYAAYIFAAVVFLGGIAKLSRYNLNVLLGKSEKTEQPAITQPPLNKVSTTGGNSPAVITHDGDVNINYGEIKPKKDSTHKK